MGCYTSLTIPAGNLQVPTYFLIPENFKLRNLTSIYPSMTGEKLFIGSTTHGAKLFDIQTNSYKDLMNKEVEQTEICVNDFMQTTPDEVWMASESGLYIYSLSKDSYFLINKRQQDPYSLSTNSLLTLFKDKENGIWLGTYSGGINYYTPFQPFQKFYAYPDLKMLWKETSSMILQLTSTTIYGLPLKMPD